MWEMSVHPLNCIVNKIVFKINVLRGWVGWGKVGGNGDNCIQISIKKCF